MIFLSSGAMITHAEIILQITQLMLVLHHMNGRATTLQQQKTVSQHLLYHCRLRQSALQQLTTHYYRTRLNFQSSLQYAKMQIHPHYMKISNIQMYLSKFPNAQLYLVIYTVPTTNKTKWWLLTEHLMVSLHTFAHRQIFTFGVIYQLVLTQLWKGWIIV